ncbi:MAG: serine kinase [Pseudomonadota bacterium]
MSSQTVHATCVARDQRGVLIMGASGSGKSSLGLQLMAFGAALVADDRTHLQARDERLIASSPTAISGLIEARGVGILTVASTETANVVLVVDLDQLETERVPPLRHITLLGCHIPLIYRAEAPIFAPAIWQILKAGQTNR